MLDFKSMSSESFKDFCSRNLVPVTFKTCNQCNKVYTPDDNKSDTCICGASKDITVRRFPRSMLITYLEAMRGIYRWK